MPMPPLSQDLPPEALRVLALATPLATPCGDGRIAWHAWGHEGGEPLVLLHGGSGSWTHWIRNVEALAAAGRRVMVPDLPGFGDSAAPAQGTDADAIVEPLAEGIRSLLGDAPVDVVGFSFGGLTGGLMAAAHPRRVKRLVIVGAPGLGLRGRRLPLSAWRHLEDTAARNEVHRANLATLMLHDPAAIDDLAVALQAANVPRDRMRGRGLAFTDILARTLGTLACPVDAIYGVHDALYADRIDALVAVLRGVPALSRLVLVERAGHWVQYEAPDEFNKRLLEILP